jgi:YggT family protein
MVSGIFLFTLKLICSVFGTALILRAYLQYLGVPGNDPIYRFIYQITQWAVQPASAFIPRLRYVDASSLFVGYLTAFVYLLFVWLSSAGAISFFHVIWGAVALLLYWAVDLSMWAVLIFCVMTWVNPMSPVCRTLRYLTDPLLKPFRRVIPVWKNIDFSAVAYIVCATIVSRILIELF